MKCYNMEALNISIWNDDEKTYRTWTWTTIEASANMDTVSFLFLIFIVFNVYERHVANSIFFQKISRNDRLWDR